MIDLSSGHSLVISGNQLRKAFDKNTLLTSEIKCWDLLTIEAILTVDTLQDDQKRQEVLHRQRKRSNMLTGAVLGGLLDAGNGDDSIIDGVLIGAAFGSICTSSARDPKAQIGLLFSDGEHLSLEVDKHEYSRLQTIVASNQKKGVIQAESSKTRSLDSSEVGDILSKRSISSFMLKMMMGIMIIFIGAHNAEFFKLILGEEAGQIPEPLRLIVFGVVIGAGVLMLMRTCFELSTGGSNIYYNDEEKEYHQSFNQKKVDDSDTASST